VRRTFPAPAGRPAGSGAAGSADGPLCVSRAARRVFAGESAAALHPDLRGFLADLARPYGLTLRDDLLARGSGQSYGEMAADLMGTAVPADQPVDLIVLAFAVPDVWPERATASYLSHACPGDPVAFALCDQGTAAAFTGLRLAREYARGGGCRRVLLLVVEQAALHYEPAGPVAPVARHAAVALLCDDTGTARLHTVRQHAGVTPAEVADLLTAGVADLSAGQEVTLVIGHDLACLAGVGPGQAPGDGPRASAGRVRIAPGAQVRIAPAGQPSTGVWWELAGGLPAWTAEGRRVLLAEYDQSLRYLCLSALDAGAAPPRRQPPAARRQRHAAL
jgi:hypothetical protein